jgi:hypothetical protein
MVLGKISNGYADMIFDEKDSKTRTRPLKQKVAEAVGRLLYVDNKDAIKVYQGRTALTRVLTSYKNVVFFVYASNVDDKNLNINVSGTYFDKSSGVERVAAISHDEEITIGDGVFELLSAYINIKIKQPHRDLSKELMKTPLPVDVNRLIRVMAYGEIPPPAIIKKLYGGKKKTRKGKKTSRKLRKLRKTRGRK